MCGGSPAGTGRGPYQLAAALGPGRTYHGRPGGPRAHEPGRTRLAGSGRPTFFPGALAVVAGAVALVSFAPGSLWLFFIVGWLLLPALGAALGALYRGAARLPERRAAPKKAAADGERELLLALREHGELSPARAAMATSLSVAEADRMLKELTGAGHLEVRARGGGLFYALWEPDPQPRQTLTPGTPGSADDGLGR